MAVKGEKSKSAAEMLLPQKKPRYESPTVVPLGELARGIGATCSPGSVPSGKCNTGATPTKCKAGSGG
jgi:hypothetical protein